MAWARGEADIQRLIEERAIERVPQSPEHARALWESAESALRVAVEAGSSFSRYGWLRRRRNHSEYPSPDTPPMSAGHASEAIEAASAMLQDAKRLLDSGALDRF